VANRVSPRQCAESAGVECTAARLEAAPRSRGWRRPSSSDRRDGLRQLCAATRSVLCCRRLRPRWLVPGLAYGRAARHRPCYCGIASPAERRPGGPLDAGLKGCKTDAERSGAASPLRWDREFESRFLQHRGDRLSGRAAGQADRAVRARAHRPVSTAEIAALERDGCPPLGSTHCYAVCYATRQYQPVLERIRTD